MFQGIILITSALSIWFVSRKESWGRYGFLIGFLGQPFWLIETYKSKQGGMFLLSLWYFYVWGQGIYFHIIKKGE